MAALSPAAASVTWLVALCALVATAHAAGCSVDVNTAAMPVPQPVLLEASYTRNFSSFLRPNSKSILLLAEGQQLIAACPGSSFYVLSTGTNHVMAHCEDKTVFQVDGTKRTMNGLGCTATVTPTARFSGETCGYRGRHAVVEVGFVVGADFYRLYDACFSNSTLNTIYSHHVIASDVDGAQTLGAVPAWVDGNFYGAVVVDEAYEEQNMTLETLNINSSYVSDVNYLARSTLVPAADFLLETQQIASFVGVNSAPRWTQLDEGNWATLEESLRKLSSGRQKDVEVYTGTHGVLALPDGNGVATEIYLSSSNGKDRLPVPKYFWKIVYDRTNGLGAAFVTVNNPYATQEELKALYRLCTDICDKVDWIQWDQSSVTKGMSYCCDYYEFKKRVPDAPSVGVNGYQSAASSQWRPNASLMVAFAVTATYKYIYDGV